MALNATKPRLGAAGASEMFSCGGWNASESNAPHFTRQVRRLVDRFGITPAVANVVAELHYHAAEGAGR
jgi:hypothetical protein